MGFFILHSSSILHMKGVATPKNKKKNNKRTMNEMMDKKYIDDDSQYATKGVAGTALGLGIGSLGLQLLNGQLGNLLGGGNKDVPFEESAFGLYKSQRDATDAIMAKHNEDAFSLYKGYRDGYDVLKAQIDAINCKLAVADTNIAWQNKNLHDAIALEAERRECGDNKIVTYVNTTFYPKYVADITTSSGTTQQSIFNPLCGGCNC